MARKLLTLLWRLLSAPFRWIGSSIRDFRSLMTEEVEDRSFTEAISTSFERPKELMVHFDALRKHIFRSLAYLTVTTAVSFTIITPILEFLTRPLEGGLETLQAIDVTEGVGTVMRVALLAGFVLAFPLIAYEVWRFVAEGLHRRERLPTLLAIPIALLFFVAGMAFSYYLMLPAALPVLLNFMGIETIPRPNSYFPFVVNLLFWMGLAFEFPLVIFILARLGLVQGRALAAQWRLAIVIIAILSALITTTTDPANMALMMLPLTVLYFISIGLAYVGHKPRRQEEPTPSELSTPTLP